MGDNIVLMWLPLLLLSLKPQWKNMIYDALNFRFLKGLFKEHWILAALACRQVISISLCLNLLCVHATLQKLCAYTVPSKSSWTICKIYKIYIDI